jgi:TrmH family RNA methyltransferase
VHVRPLSARNPRVQRLTRLVKRREERAEQRAFVVEGPVLVTAALDGDAQVLEVYVGADHVDRPTVAAVIDRIDPALPCWELPPGVLDRVGDAATSQGILAVVERHEAPWPTPDSAPFVLVLAEVADPGNAGTLIRAAAAAGAGAVVVGGGVDPTSPKVVRASAGAVLGIDVVAADSPADAVARLHNLGYRVLATSVRSGTPHSQVDLGGPVAIVVGNEASGVGALVMSAADEIVTIPMAGPTESLNVAMAGTILCFEVLRRQGEARD